MWWCNVNRRCVWTWSKSIISQTKQKMSDILLNAFALLMDNELHAIELHALILATYVAWYIALYYNTDSNKNYYKSNVKCQMLAGIFTRGDNFTFKWPVMIICVLSHEKLVYTLDTNQILILYWDWEHAHMHLKTYFLLTIPLYYMLQTIRYMHKFNGVRYVVVMATMLSTCKPNWLLIQTTPVKRYQKCIVYTSPVSVHVIMVLSSSQDGA